MFSAYQYGDTIDSCSVITTPNFLGFDYIN